MAFVQHRIVTDNQENNNANTRYFGQSTHFAKYDITDSHYTVHVIIIISKRSGVLVHERFIE